MSFISQPGSPITAIPVTVPEGGTGQVALSANNVVLGNGVNPVQLVAPGASGNVLSSNGTTWASAAPVTPTQAFNLILTQTVSGVSSCDFTGLTTYNNLILFINNYVPTSATAGLNLRIGHSGGLYNTNVYRRTTQSLQSGTPTFSATFNDLRDAYELFFTTIDTTSAKGVGGTVQLFDCLTAGVEVKAIGNIGVYQNSGGPFWTYQQSYGTAVKASGFDRISIYSGVTFSGKFSLYGITQ